MLPAPSDLPLYRDRLYRVTGQPNEHLSWLEPVWHGEIARVVLYQVVPPWAASPMFWDADQEKRVARIRGFLGPDPRYRLSLNPQVLTHYQWTLYERFGSVAQPFWIVQGSHGGHKRQFADVEQRLLRALKLPEHPPAPGALPFAPVDERTIRALAPLDEMRMWAKAKALYERTPEDFDRAEQDAVTRGSQKLTAWLTEQVAHAFDDVVTYRKTVRDIFEPAGARDARLADDEAIAALDAR